MQTVAPSCWCERIAFTVANCGAGVCLLTVLSQVKFGDDSASVVEFGLVRLVTVIVVAVVSSVVFIEVLVAMES